MSQPNQPQKPNDNDLLEKAGYLALGHYGQFTYLIPLMVYIGLWGKYPRPMKFAHGGLIGLIVYAIFFAPHSDPKPLLTKPTGYLIFTPETALKFGTDPRYPKVGKPLPIQVGFRKAYDAQKNGMVIQVVGNAGCEPLDLLMEVKTATTPIPYKIHVRQGTQTEVGWKELKTFKIQTGQHVVFSAQGYDVMVVIVP